MCPSEVNELETEPSSLYSHVFRGESVGSELGSHEHGGRGPVMAEDTMVTASPYQVMLRRVQHCFLRGFMEPTVR